MTDDKQKIERAELGVDGNAGFALLGADIQSGDAEFVTIESDAPMGSTAWQVAAVSAATKAYRNLHKRFPDRVFSYYIGPSHPNYT